MVAGVSLAVSGHCSATKRSFRLTNQMGERSRLWTGTDSESAPVMRCQAAELSRARRECALMSRVVSVGFGLTVNDMDLSFEEYRKRQRRTGPAVGRLGRGSCHADGRLFA